jgi:hypothetical protein
LLLASSLALIASFTIGCGGAGGSGGGNTSVTLLATSTANDQLSQFSITLNSLTLTSQSGKTLSLLAAPLSDEFMHLNGTVEPLTSVSIPSDVYTSASAIVAWASPACVGLDLTDEALGGIEYAPVSFKVNLPAPITVAGTAMGLALNLQVAESAPFSGGCSNSLTNTIFVTPAFNLTPVVIAAQPTNSANGKALGLEGLIGSIDASGDGMTVNALYSINTNDPPTWQVNLNSATVFQGVGGSSQLAAGMAVDMDLAIEADGSLLATRVAVPDTNAANLSVANGPPTQVTPSNQQIYALEVEQEGVALSGLDNIFGYANATFQISSQFTNLQSLPFAATFTAANMVDGQNIFFSTHAQRVNGFPPLPTPVTTMTLMPQTINGTVSAISSAGGFTTYTVTLASYDLFPILAVQPGQTTLLTNPGTVVVYADSNAQILNGAPTVGGMFRFYGLVFNDAGTLRIDCAQIAAGVAE